jgi:adenine-specific DNA-methyltransferase|tara:strand:- start:336 stop:1418 length:1083 start_codon:yes stop_codon:yes gene_type:complete
MSSKEIISEASNKKIRTVAYKGSKRKLLGDIQCLADEINAKTVFDGFSGTGIVSAFLRRNGMKVYANDLNFSSYLYGKVFLEGYDEKEVQNHIKIMNSLKPIEGWLTENYSGTKKRKVRTLKGLHERPLAYRRKNAMKIDAAREYIDANENIGDEARNALIFGVVLAADSVFNNSNDQKSSLKNWSKKANKEVEFVAPTLIEGAKGEQFIGDIFSTDIPQDVDMVYYDPPYTSGVLYGSCYHLNDTIAIWDKPTLQFDYALPRPERASYRSKNVGSFYSKKTVKDDFRKILSSAKKARRIVLSYSDAPRNAIEIGELENVCREFGGVEVRHREHKICTQIKSQVRRSEKLQEFFILVDPK